MSINYINFRFVFNSFLFLWILFIPFKNAFYQASTFLLIVIFFIYVVLNKDYNHIKKLALLYKDITFAFILVLISMTVSNLLNDVSKTNAWYLELAYLYRYALILLVLFYFYSKHFFDKKLLIIFIFISLGIQVFDGIYQAVIGHDLFGNQLGDLNGWTGAVFNRNVFGLIMGLGVLISFFVIQFYKKISIKTVTLSILFSLFIVATLFSFSRAVWVSLVVTFSLYIAINLRNFNKKDLFYFITFLVILTTIFYNIDSLQNRFLQLISTNSSHRNEIWSQTIELFKEKLLFGWGLNIWKIQGLKEFSNVHNSILEILVSLGTVGLITFTYFLYLVFKQIKNSKNLNAFYILIFLMIDSLFDQSIISGKIFLSIIVILIFYIYLDRIKNDKKGELLK